MTHGFDEHQAVACELETYYEPGEHQHRHDLEEAEPQVPPDGAQLLEVDLAEHHKQGEEHEDGEQRCHDGLEEEARRVKGRHEGKQEVKG